ncbi:MAG TPA: purine-nucleoside phosphorylase [Spirochaetia bacterium]|nr:purine-nucleoside phosphorylase [Spirochaetia bacterium]HBI36134.1 purine-nucleoside phosphorylase [Spirochaetia bacterium]
MQELYINGGFSMPIHIEAQAGDVAECVLLVGDPDRATHIAETFFDNPVCYTQYRHMFGYTGTYKGKRVSVQTSGMGTPSLSIIVEELHMLGVKQIVRIGTCGTISSTIQLGDTIVATASHSSHDMCRREFPGASFSAAPDFELTVKIYTYLNGKKEVSRVHAGTVLCSETFYEDTFDVYKKFGDFGTLGVEMESYALFYLGAKYGMKTATVLTVSDVIFEKKRAEKNIIKQSVERNTVAVLECLLV